MLNTRSFIIPLALISSVLNALSRENPHLVFQNVASANCPVWIANASDGTGRVFFVEQHGTVRIVGEEMPFLNLQPSSVTVTPVGGGEPYLWPPQRNISLVSVAFPTNYASKGYFYLSYFDHDQSGFLKISRFGVSTNANIADAASERVIARYSDIGCNGGQVVFASDATLYLNLAGPIANATLPGFSEDLDALSGKMVPILNENGPVPQNGSETYWPFDQYFSPTDCSVIGGVFCDQTHNRLQGFYIYGDDSGTVWGLKLAGSEWKQFRLASPSFTTPFPVNLILPTSIKPDTNTTITLIPPNITLPTNLTVTIARENIPRSSINIHRPEVRGSRLSSSNSVSADDSEPQGNTYPFTIAAFGTDEAGQIYVANYGIGYWTQEPPAFTSVEEFAGGGIYLLQDDPLESAAQTVVTGRHASLEWQSLAGVTYRCQASLDSIHWFDFGRAMIGNGKKVAVSIPHPTSLHYRVVAAARKK